MNIPAVFVITMGDVLGLIGFLSCLFIAAYIYAKERIRQSKCAHSDVTETQACDAICRKCGKNLGFIGKWRDTKLKEKNS